MANPAELLFNLFTRWNNQNQTAQTARSDEALVEHRRAVRLLDDLDRLITIAEADQKRVSIYRRHFPAWVATVFNYPNCWASGNTGTISTVLLEHLENLIDLVDPYIPEIDVQKLPLLQDYLVEVSGALVADTSLPHALRVEALAIVNHLRCCIDDLNVRGTLDLQDAVNRFLGVLLRVAQMSRKKSAWKTVFEQWVNPFVVGNVTAITGSQLLALMAAGVV